MPAVIASTAHDLADVLHGEINSVGERALILAPRSKEFLAQDLAGVGAGSGHGTRLTMPGPETDLVSLRPH